MAAFVFGFVLFLAMAARSGENLFFWEALILHGLFRTFP